MTVGVGTVTRDSWLEPLCNSAALYCRTAFNSSPRLQLLLIIIEAAPHLFLKLANNGPNGTKFWLCVYLILEYLLTE